MSLPFPLSMVGTGAGGAISIISTAYASGSDAIWSCPTLLANDVLLFCYADDSGSGGTITGNFTADFVATQIGVVNRGSAASVLYWYRAAGSETPGNDIAVYNSFANHSVVNGIMVQLRGCKTSGNPYEGWATANGSSTDTGPTATTVTTAANGMGLRFYCRSNSGTVSAAPSGWTEQREGTDGTGGLNGVTMALDSKTITSATTEAATTRTVGGSSAAWVTHGLAMLAA